MKDMTHLETKLRAAFQAANERQAAGLDELFSLYHEDVYFEDPLQRIHDKAAFTATIRRMYHTLTDIEFLLQSFSEAGDEAHATWTMRFRPRFGPRISLEGASHLRLRGGKILYHRDYWDLLSSLLETSPVTALAYRAISRRLV
jgi:ketosteroid isomerase-like protein